MTEHDDHGVCLTDDVLVELALDQLDGRERAAALSHAAACADCGPRVRELVDVTELLLLSAPASEPPVGFESEVLRSLRRPRVGRRRVLLAAAAMALVAVAAVVSLLAVVGRGSSVAEARMITPSGRDVGAAWLHDDDASWIFVAVPDWKVWQRPDGSTPDYRLEATLDDDSVVDIGVVTFDDDGAWASTLGDEADDIDGVAIVDDSGRVWCEGRF